jgi:hypothetical protein
LGSEKKEKKIVTVKNFRFVFYMSETIFDNRYAKPNEILNEQKGKIKL